MKCLICGVFSFKLICKKCQNRFLEPELLYQKLSCGLDVYSFYHFSEIEELVKSKYYIFGGSIYEILGKKSFSKYAKEFKYKFPIYALPIDDYPVPNFSHSAILAKNLQSKFIIPKYNKLRAKSRISYAGKSLDFRLKNPRNFSYTFKKNIEVILVDDVITTGLTLSEAHSLLLQNDVRILFALTLAK